MFFVHPRVFNTSLSSKCILHFLRLGTRAGIGPVLYCYLLKSVHRYPTCRFRMPMLPYPIAVEPFMTLRHPFDQQSYFERDADSFKPNDCRFSPLFSSHPTPPFRIIAQPVTFGAALMPHFSSHMLRVVHAKRKQYDFQAIYCDGCSLTEARCLCMRG